MPVILIILGITHLNKKNPKIGGVRPHAPYFLYLFMNCVSSKSINVRSYAVEGEHAKLKA